MAKQYYASRTPGKAGIFYGNWAECSNLIQGPGQDFKGFPTMESAAEYIHKYPRYLQVQNTVKQSALPQDLPFSLYQGLLQLFNAKRIADIDPETRAYIKEAFRDAYNDEIAVDYKGRTKEYAMMYLPVNMYKIWLPLRKLLSDHCLPIEYQIGNNTLPLKILELGAGPGTSTFGLLDFYKALANENPEKRFIIIYHIVELEQDFEDVFLSLIESYMKEIPSNMTVSIQRTIQRDAEKHMLYCTGMDYDLIIESNMINASEHHSDDYKVRLIPDIISALRPGGFAILVEPGKLTNINMIKQLISKCSENIWQNPEKASISMKNNTIYLEQCRKDIGMRYSGYMEHWMSSCILTKPFREMVF